MKKCLLVFVILALATGAFAQVSLSVGGGVLFDGSFNNGIKIDESGIKGSMGLNNISFGGFVFFDATYVEADISFAYGFSKIYLKGILNDPSISDEIPKITLLQLGFSILGKYPFELGSITIFPLLGISYNVVLNAWDDDGNSLNDGGESAAKWLSQFGILGGVGLDFDITDSLYFRGEALFQIRFPTKLMKDAKDDSNSYLGVNLIKTTLGLGPVIKLALGYKF